MFWMRMNGTRSKTGKKQRKKEKYYTRVPKNAQYASEIIVWAMNICMRGKNKNVQAAAAVLTSTQSVPEVCQAQTLGS